MYEGLKKGAFCSRRLSENSRGLVKKQCIYE